MAEIHEVAPGGHVRLIFGSEGNGNCTHILVSSVVLSFGSPVFKAMLGPHFKEGATLATGARLDLPLPEDCPQAMLSICEVMHMKKPTCPTPEVGSLLKMARLVDKYDCRAAMFFAMKEWIRLASGKSTDRSGLDLFIIAYLMESPTDFKKYGRLVISRTPPFISITAPEGIDDNLRRMIEALSKRRDELMGGVVTQVQGMIDEECARDDTRPGRCLPGCTYIPTRLFNFTKSLTKSDIWPVMHFKDKSLHAMHTALLSLPSDWTDSLEHCDSDSVCEGFFMDSSEDIRCILHQVASVLELEIPDVCLMCVKGGVVKTQRVCCKKPGH